MVTTFLNKENSSSSSQKVSQYDSQCDHSNIRAVVCVIRISLSNRDRRYAGELFHQGSLIQCITLKL
jgi:hypothetical protein